MQVNANVGLCFGGWSVVGLQAPFEDEVLAIVADDKNAAQAIARRRPQPLNAIHGAAIADDPQYWPVWKSQRCPHGGRQAPADATALQAEIVPRMTTRQKFTQTSTRGDRFIDHDNVLRHAVGNDFVHYQG